MSQDSPIANIINKIIKNLVRTIVEAQVAYPLSFKPFLSAFLTLFYDCATGPTAGVMVSHCEPFMIQTLGFLEKVIDNAEYKVNLTKADSEASTKLENIEAQEIIMNFFTSEKVWALVQFLIQNYFPLTLKDTKEWSNDPEKYYLQQQSLTKEERIRPAAESLYSTLIVSNEMPLHFQYT